PKFIRDQIPEIDENQIESYRFTNSLEAATEDVPIINESHPLLNVGLQLMKQETEGFSWKHYKIRTNVPERLHLELYEITVVDGTGKILESHMIHLGKRDTGEVITLEPNWIFNNQFEEIDIQEEIVGNQQCITEIMEKSVEILDRLYGKREKQLKKIYTLLEKSFNQQYREALKRLDQYQQENVDNRNSALINQMNAKLMDLDIKKEERLELVNQQKNISLKPPKLVISLDAVPTGECQRVLANDYYDVVSEYERANGRLNVKQYNNLGLIDFPSERFNGEQRFIVLTIDPGFTFSENELEDLGDILEMVYVYVVDGGEVRDERKILERLL